MATKSKSNWGKLQDGQHFQVLALDVFRALALSGMNTYEWAIMQYVIEQSWYTSLKAQGKAQPAAPCNLCMTELAKALAGEGRPFKSIRTLLYRALRSLLAKNMLVEMGGLYTPNKNADEWVKPDDKSPLMPDGFTGYAASVQVGRKPSTTPKTYDQSVTPRDTKQSHGVVPNGGTPYDQSVTPCDTKRSHDVPRANKEPRASEDLGRLQKTEEDGPSSPPASPQKPVVEIGTRTPEFLALCKAAKAIPALQAHKFAKVLFDSWESAAGSKLRAWWDMIPAAEWTAGLTDLIGATEGQLATVNFYVAIVRNPNTRAKRAREAANTSKAIKDIPSPMVNGWCPDWYVFPPFDDSAKPRTIKFAQGGAA